MTIETTVSKSWLVRAVIMIVLGFGFAAWSVYDATVVYPKRGEVYAQYVEAQWLHTLGPAIRSAPEKVANPVDEYKRLRDKARQKSSMTPEEQDRYNWFKALSAIGKLEEAPQRVSDPVKRLDELDTRFKGVPTPKKLNPYDIPSQWAILVVGSIVGLWSLISIIRVSRHKFIYNKEDGSLKIDSLVIAAEEMTGLDKRRWQKKSIAYLITRDGKKHKLDDWYYARTAEIVEILDEKLEGGDDKSDAENEKSQGNTVSQQEQPVDS
ncbi:MAG TPA: hypothetical protein ENJ06_06120 [Phycisphaeraceae bacterium]|nr:hypothetical protein [Phycisphaeraceae bacterium]